MLPLKKGHKGINNGYEKTRTPETVAFGDLFRVVWAGGAQKQRLNR